jgi:hypothetical protein
MEGYQAVHDPPQCHMCCFRAKIRFILGFKSYVNFFRGPKSLVSGPRSWELSCRNGITVPLQKLEKMESQDFSGFLQENAT